jgi:hypothetical protein
MKNILLLISIILASCAVNQKIIYEFDDIKVPPNNVPLPITVEFRTLKDNRPTLAENKVLFTSPHRTRIDGKMACINSERHYNKDSVVAQLSKILVYHFNKAALFNRTFYQHSKFSTHYLTGTLNSFYGDQEYSNAAAVGASFGIIGAIATANIKTPGKIIIEISDLKLFKNDGTLVKDFGSFYKEYNEDMHVDANCWCIFANMNEKLKDFNIHLIEKIRSDMAGVPLK